MIEYLVGVGVALTAWAGASQLHKSNEPQTRLIGPGAFALQFRHLIQHRETRCAHCNNAVTAETASTLFSRDGETVLAVCKRTLCMAAYASERQQTATISEAEAVLV